MCLTAPAQVVCLTDDGAVVEVAGVRRRASTLVMPDAAVGDWVMVGAGTILRRLDATEALEIDRTIKTAAAAAAVRAATTGGPR